MQYIQGLVSNRQPFFRPFSTNHLQVYTKLRIFAIHS